MGKKRQRSEEPEAVEAATAGGAGQQQQPVSSVAGMTYVSVRTGGKHGECAGLFLQPTTDARQLFCLFADQELDDETLKEALAAAGDVRIGGRRGTVVGGCSFRCCVLQFGAAKGVSKALGLASTFPTQDARTGAPLGLRAWLGALEEGRVDQRALQGAVDGYMAAFDAAQGAKEAAVATLATRMEADGFTLVTKGKKPKLEDAVDTGALGAAFESDNAKRKKKRGSVAKADFYGFQSRENKLDKLAELRRRFEEDKERVRRIKEARAFKPY